MAHTETISEAGRILVIDDESVVVDVLRGVLGKVGYRIHAADDATTGREMLASGHWDALLLDVMLPDADGLQMLRWVRERRPDLAVVMITAFGSVEDAVDAMNAGAFHYLTKPFKNDEVRHLVAQAVQTTRLRLENKDLRQALEARGRFEKIVGRSKPMQEIYRFIEQVAPSRSTVLIQGESGTGKELVAQAIHRRSTRTGGPFVVVNSSSIPQDLLEDSLFGHVRGAFTGADSDRIGLLQAAHRGTILFDEITTISPAVQAKLLRTMQEKEILPLGSVTSRRVDVRILAATNEDIKAMVSRGDFREDLYYRLNVIQVQLPALRERASDIPHLVAHFLERYNAENDKHVTQFAPDAMQRLLAYSWPGNVRELENAVERGVVLCTEEQIQLGLLPREVRESAPTPGRQAVAGPVNLSESLAGYERRLIEEALARSGGVQKRAAELLGLKPTTLNEKMKRLKIRAVPR